MRRPDSAFSAFKPERVSGLKALELMAEGDTVIHRVHTFVKLTATIVYVVVVISFGRYDIGGLLPYFLYPAILTPLSDTPWRAVWRRLLPALPFPLLGGVSNIIFDKAPMIMIGGVALTGGVISFASIMIKALLSVWAVLLLVATTGVSELSRQLSALGVPDAAIVQFNLTYRYLAVLADEARAMYESYILRSADIRGIRVRDMGAFVGTLLLRSIDRAERVYAAMKCRGFSGSYLAPAHGARGKIGAPDLLCLFAVCAAIIILRCLS
ncbi:hypothetical protein FACS1894167_01730 [Synergistales bacterium]|nr:hypothetical protein FACS1894167_01730 [Synergistales bacterium]